MEFVYKCIIGLGNPGNQNTSRHNVARLYLDSLGSSWNRINNGEVSVIEGIILYKPSGSINTCGQQIKQAVKQFRITNEEFIVIHDNIDIPLGQIVVNKHNAKGHSGIKSLTQAFQNQEFNKLHIGIGRPTGGEIKDYVLSSFSRNELEYLHNNVYPQCSRQLRLCR
ncbi:hypothetical protein SteCoe_19198 [Stentor coeruleus]|uniref:Peptidyl-tRNA hydrolase n=1 Tax=Stentor coeruleus TaxID=5963 RepID=A0A1R2BUS4_9CILI|nr:hypothetical protein SteCoe_19198 [Stentor coeruleus]